MRGKKKAPAMRIVDISVEVNGTVHHGKQVIMGTTTLRQHVQYDGRSAHDGHEYSSDDPNMHRHAVQFLRELVMGNL
jgi:hypothetical protein